MLVEHDYDPVSDAVVSWSLRPGQSAGQSFTIAGPAEVTGFRIKLQQVGEAAPLEYRLRRQPGGAVIAAGVLPGPINPWFERWQGVDFPRPVRCDGRYKLELRLPAAASNSYEIYGTAEAPVARPEFQPRFRYRPEWSAEELGPGPFENPANLDYGARTPRYGGGAAFDSQGREISGLDFAFRILGPGGKPASACQERFAFVDEITRPLWTRSLRDADARPGPDEIVLGPSWKLEYVPVEPVATAAKEFQAFLETAMSARLGLGPKRITVAIVGEASSRSEGFRLKVAPDRVEIRAGDARGAMRGLHFLEARMRLRRAPFLKLGEEVREPRFSPRITCAPVLAKTELDGSADPYTPGLLGRISRAGFSAIWLWGDLDQVAHSSVYPELDQGARLRQARLNNLIQRAARYGLDVYLYLASRPLPESFFARHPEVRGAELRAYGGTHVLCASVPEVRRHYAAAVEDLFRNVPQLAGIIFIVGGEGFMHCYTRKNSCPRCLARPPEAVIAGLSAGLLAGVRAAGSQADVVLWPYSASNTWSRDDRNQSRLIEKLPPGLTFMTEFAKEGAVTFDGVSVPAYDYPISLVGPSERFLAQAALARKRGLDFWVKTEHAIALEFVQTPYIPALSQWAERFRRIRESPGVKGVMANWMHYGFMPTLASDVFYWNIWSTAVDTGELLHSLARRDFGAAAAPHAVRAWEAFSEAIQRYPFSGPMAMGVLQKGPAHPLFLDARYQPAHGAGRQFKNDLSWTRPWGTELAVRQLREMDRLWRQGIAALEQAVARAEPALRENAIRELGVAEALGACVRAAIHVARFYHLRERLDETRDPKLLDEMASVARAELENAQRALPLACADSRLGWANSGRGDQTGVPRAGIYSPGAIAKKIAQLRRLLEIELPQLRRFSAEK